MQQNMEGLSKLLMLIGALLLVSGVILYLWKDRIGFSWFGNLPGDIKIEGEHYRFYAPLATMLLFSLLINLIFKIIQRFW